MIIKNTPNSCPEKYKLLTEIKNKEYFTKNGARIRGSYIVCFYVLYLPPILAPKNTNYLRKLKIRNILQKTGQELGVVI
jgi:hypothetical protein